APSAAGGAWSSSRPEAPIRCAGRRQPRPQWFPASARWRRSGRHTTNARSPVPRSSAGTASCPRDRFLFGDGLRLTLALMDTHGTEQALSTKRQSYERINLGINFSNQESQGSLAGCVHLSLGRVRWLDRKPHGGQTKSAIKRRLR